MNLSFNNEQVKGSNGIYRLIVETIISEKRLTLDQLEDLYFNKIEDATNYKWLVFSKTMEKKESTRDMLFGTFRTWMQLLDIELNIDVSAGGMSVGEMQELINPTDLPDLAITGNSFYEEAPEKKEEVVFDSEDNDDLMEDTTDEDMEYIQQFLDYSLELVSYGISTPVENVAEFLRSKLTQGLAMIGVEDGYTIATVEGTVENGVKFFLVNLLYDGQLITAIKADKY